MSKVADCPLCSGDGGQILVQAAQWRIVMPTEPDTQPFPGFTRVVWQAHQREMTDLNETEQRLLMGVVFGVEALIREHLSPTKVNLASLGNQVDHLHWHVIARWESDSHFPSPVWSAPKQGSDNFQISPDRLDQYRQALIDRFSY